MLALAAIATPGLSQGSWLIKQDIESRVYSPGVWDSVRHRVVVFGGNINNGTGNETIEWDGQEWVRRQPANAPRARSSHAMAFDEARGETVLFGGAGASNDTWVFDGHDWTQRFPASRPRGRIGHAVAYDPTRKRVVLFGGSSGGLLNDTWEWDGTNWTQRFPHNVPGPREYHRMAYDPVSRSVVMFGGVTSANQDLGETWAWDGADWTLLQPANSPPATQRFAMATHDGLGRVWMYDSSYSHAELWEWSGSDWTRLNAIKNGNPPFDLSCFAYDGNRNRMLTAFDSESATTWEFTGTAWSLVDVRPRVNNLVMATDTTRNRVIMHCSGFYTPRFTWEWDGERWHAPSPANPVTADLIFASMAYDGARQRTVLFGGATTGFIAQDNTWLWDGTNWTSITPPQKPPARWSAAMTYDPTTRRTILFGGNSAKGALNDTWAFDGTALTQLSPPTSPPPTAFATMAYDPVRSRTVLVGSDLHQTWEWDGATWTPVPSPNYPGVHFGTTTWYPVRQQVVLYDKGNLWAWDGTDWTLVKGTEVFSPDCIAWDPNQRRLLTMQRGLTQTWLFGANVPAAATPFGDGCSGSHGVPALSAWGEPSIGRTRFRLELTSGRATAPAIALFGPTSTSTRFGGCVLLVAPTGLVTLPLPRTNTGGFTALDFPIPPGPAFLGQALSTQGAVLDPNGAGGGLVALTNGLRLTVGN